MKGKRGKEPTGERESNGQGSKVTNVTKKRGKNYRKNPR